MRQERGVAPVLDRAPTDDRLTDYDRRHLATYLQLLDAAAAGADWRTAAQQLLGIDAAAEPARARVAYDSHLTRARWMTETGYRHILRDDDPADDSPGV